MEIWKQKCTITFLGLPLIHVFLHCDDQNMQNALVCIDSSTPISFIPESSFIWLFYSLCIFRGPGEIVCQLRCLSSARSQRERSVSLCGAVHCELQVRVLKNPFLGPWRRGMEGGGVVRVREGGVWSLGWSLWTMEENGRKGLCMWKEGSWVW